jgi:hypothetical protein
MEMLHREEEERKEISIGITLDERMKIAMVLDVVNEFYRYAKGSEHTQLIQLMEIHALVIILSNLNSLNFNTFVFVSFVWVVRVGKRLAKS